MKFKLYFPAGYRILNVEDEHVDVYIITEDSCVYFATLFSVKLMLFLMEKNKEDYFWVADMVILHDMKESTINNAIANLVSSDSLELIVSKIGNVEIFKKHDFYPQLNDWTSDTPAWIMASWFTAPTGS